MTNNLGKLLIRELDWLFMPTKIIRQDVLPGRKKMSKEGYAILVIGATLLEFSGDYTYYCLYKYLS